MIGENALSLNPTDRAALTTNEQFEIVSPTDKEAVKLLLEFQQNAVEVLSSGYIGNPDQPSNPYFWPIAFVHPDCLPQLTVMAQFNNQPHEVRYAWDYIRPVIGRFNRALLKLNVFFVLPNTEEYALAIWFDLMRHERFLERVLHHRKLLITVQKEKNLRAGLSLEALKGRPSLPISFADDGSDLVLKQALEDIENLKLVRQSPQVDLAKSVVPRKEIYHRKPKKH